MRLTHFFIERPIFAGVLSVLILLAGLVSAFVLPVSEYPEVSPPTVVVTAQYPGANPQVIADTVSSPLEQEIIGVEGMIYMNSQAQQDGTLQITVVFRQGTDIDTAQVQVQNRVAQALPRLPEEVRNFGVTTRKSSPDLTMVVHLFSPDGRYDGLYLRNYAVIQVRDVLARLPGAGDVRIFGAGDYAMRLWLDPQKMAARDLTTGDVIGAVREQNVQVAAGSVGSAPMHSDVEFQLAINTQGRLTNEQEFGDIVLKTGSDGQVTRLRDVARLEMGAGEYALRSLLDNKSAVALPVFLQPGANALDLAKNVRATMAELKKSFPEGVDYSVVYDPTVFVSDSIKKVMETLVEATLLVVLVVLLFLQRWRAALIPIIAVPVSIIGTLAALQFFGFSLNTLTLFGLVLAVGIVVDDAIVVVENVERGVAEGLAPRAAAHRSMDEVGGAIIAISLVLCAVFVPPALVPGFTGLFYRQFALTIAFASVISAINSLTLSPALAALLLRDHHARPDALQRVIDGSLGWFFRPFNRAFDATGNGYTNAVRRILRFGVIGLVVYAGLVLFAGGAFKAAPTGFVPAQDKGYLVGIVQLPPSASIERTERIAKQVGEIALKEPGVIHAVQFPGLSINGFTRSSNAAVVFLTLAPFEERGSKITGQSIATSLNQKLSAIDGAMVLMVPPPPIQGFGPAGGVKLQIEDKTNRSQQELYALTQEVLAKVRSNPQLMNAFSNYDVNAPLLYADIDRVRVKQLGIRLGDVFQTLQTYLGSFYINDFNSFGRTFRVIAQADEQYRDRPQDALLLKTRNAAGEMVPLGSVLKLRESFGATTVQRYNGYPSADINAAPAPGVSSGQAVAALTQIAEQTLPPGVGFDWTEITYQQVQKDVLGYVFPLCVLLVFLVLSAQYESLRLPFAVILIVPMCLLSASLGILLMNSEINIFTQIGLFVLIGLSAKNSILIVEFAREKQAEGMGVIEAALEACRLRLRPIIMTSVAFILGVLPLVLATGAGAEIQRSMGIAVFFGMIGVTFFGLFFTPLFYVAMRGWSERKKALEVEITPTNHTAEHAVTHH
ncbi:efflux RND transporter permease subunit [Hydrocarboniphaga effusa]|uniref:Efflux pump membrane transporter n=3 Tax=Hydrocarboniphaga effusa TaxID=243629 RepID=I8TEG5_9GAMM|nr:multidrug efflux RND transporter permease subunit [Hydrocarboniphaga effusa]EIT72083.1 AcrB/AcrD/AcrF family protein [Hydrocarboniphaga effusa AP103]